MTEDEVARTMIQRHIDECAQTNRRVEKALDNLSGRLDAMLSTRFLVMRLLLFSSGGIILSLVAYIWAAK